MHIRVALIAGMVLAQANVLAAGETSPAKLLADFRTQADAPFAADRGRQLFLQKGSDWSCSTCHTADPRAEGRHVVTGKAIAPLAPAANPQRFTDAAKVDKWFRRNCRDVLGRECTVREKGDVLTWLLSLR